MVAALGTLLLFAFAEVELVEPAIGAVRAADVAGEGLQGRLVLLDGQRGVVLLLGDLGAGAVREEVIGAQGEGLVEELLRLGDALLLM